MHFKLLIINQINIAIMILLILIFFGLSSQNISTAEPRIEIVKSEENGIYYTLYFNETSNVDTLYGYAFQVKLQDYSLNADNSISIVFESSFGGIFYQIFEKSRKTEKLIETDFYPIGTNQRLTRGFKTGGEDINPQFKILAKDNVVKVDVTGSVIYKVDFEMIKASGFSKHTKNVD